MRAVKFAAGVAPLLEPIDAVRQHPRNPNNGDVEALTESIQINGFYTAITADRSTGYILAGNHRYQALLALNATQIPVIWADPDGEGGALRVLAGDNQLSRLARMDNAALLEVLKDLQESEIGLVGSGFDDIAMELLMQQVAMDAEAPIGDGAGFGAGEAPNGIYQVVVDFYDQDQRDELFATLADDPALEGKVRTANI